MACTLTITGRLLGCKDALGGIKEVYIGPYLGHGQYATPAAGSILDATSSGGVVYQFEPATGSSSFTQTVNASSANGSVVYAQVLALTFNNMAAADVEEIHMLNKSRFSVIVVDNNNNYMVMGNRNGCEVTGGTFVSGAAAGDLNGSTMEITSFESTAAPFLTTTTGGNITFTAGT